MLHHNAQSIGFGCWQLGGHGWRNLDAAALEQAVITALDSGIQLFDTADVYGLGQSEATLGKLLAAHPNGPRALVATKGGVRIANGVRTIDNSRAWLFQAVEQSRVRLKRDVIDLYQLHWHDGTRPLNAIFDDFEEMCAKGYVNAYGISNISLAGWQRASLPPHLKTFTFEYSLINRSHEADIDIMRHQLGLIFLSWGTIGQGVLSGRYNRHSVFEANDMRARAGSAFDPMHWDRYEPLLACLVAIADKHKVAPVNIAVAWALHAQADYALVGIKNKTQLADHLLTCSCKLEPADVDALNAASDIFKTYSIRGDVA